MPPKNGAGTRPAKSKLAKNYRHPESDSPMRPEVGTLPQFKKKLPPQKYRYDDSLAPALEWDGQNPARERGEVRIAKAEQELTEAQKELAGNTDAKAATAHIATAQQAVRELKAMSSPFLNWAGKAERVSFEVPTLPLFIHERLSTKAILETLKGHKRQGDLFDLFADPQHSITDQVLRAYEHRDKWVNRMILGDSLVVMNSLLRYEGLGGQVQMIYMDPPYGVKFGSNFQPFVRKRDVVHNDDENMTREPEMVQAYRDTWELGTHSYLTYLRDRLLLARELLAATGSIFVQISDENLHHVREVMDEVFGGDNLVAIIVFQKTASATSELIANTPDFLLWFAKDRSRCKYRKLFTNKLTARAIERYDQVELPDGTRRPLSIEEKQNPDLIETTAKRFQLSATTSSRPPGDFPVEFSGQVYRPRTGYWKTGQKGMETLIVARRIVATGGGILRYVRYANDFPFEEVDSLWTDISGGVQSRSDPKIYAVQTSTSVVQRCLLMTTDPGDLVIDPTCGSGTTGYVAEQWGRRWINIDTSRVPLALARQRLLTATFPWYDLKDESRGPSAGFIYQCKQNRNHEEIGGIVPHITLKSIANNEPPEEEVLVDRPEVANAITRVTGPFCVEATIPTPLAWDEDTPKVAPVLEHASGSFVDRMLEILRKSPVLRVEGNKTVTLKNIRQPAKSLALSAEAMVDATAHGQKATLAEAVIEAQEKSGLALPLSQKTVAFVFGPENGAVSEKLVYEAAKEASAKGYTHLYVTGFAIQPHARELVDRCEEAVGIPATYVQATPDLMMGDLLKNMRSSQIFSVCGLPDAKVRKHKNGDGKPQQYEVELLGMDVFNPITMENDHRAGEDVPAWFLDADYNGLCFHVSQAFFPRTSAWENLKRALRGEYDDSVWEHLAGTVSAPFEGGENGQVAVKVIDDRGNELMKVLPLPASEAKKR